jgi:uncharacterized protein YecE (DUF72 family)
VIYLGTSGWQYAHWRQTFYPKGIAQARWLEFYAERFRIVELNNSFYMLPKEETFAKWRDRTPDDFIFAAKMNRFLTHIKKLNDPHEPVERFFRHARHLGPKLGPVLIQLPPTLKVDAVNLDETLSAIPDDVRVAVEFRHDSWWTDEIEGVLTKHGAALCMADRGERPATAQWRTADWTFLRFHAGFGKPVPCYRKKAMARWVEMLAERWPPGHDVYVFFNNDPRACALRDAILFADMALEAGYEVTRAPRRSEVKVGDPDTAAWAAQHPTGRDESRHGGTMELPWARS